MRERVTFVHASEDAYDPNQLRVEKNALHVSNLRAAREHKITFSFKELPQEIWLALKQCHELHIRWTSKTFYESISPFTSRTSPGLHVFFTPHKQKKADLLCPLLRKVFGDELDCKTPDDSFTPLPVLSERFASSSSHSFYQRLGFPTQLLDYLTHKICVRLGEPCHDRVKWLATAGYIDVDYDTISQALTIRTFSDVHTAVPREEILRPVGDSRLEVGILSSEKVTESEPETLKMGGFLTVIGEDEKPNPTLFEFPSRHHQAPGTAASKFTVRLVQPTGLHPVLGLTFDSSESPGDQCTLHSYLTLPSSIFPDKYQLSAPLFLASKNLGPIRAISGETDLEAPDWAVSRWGSSMLIELAPPSGDSSGTWHAEIPLHLRYLPPTTGGQSSTDIPYPAVFWACRAEEGTKMNVNPFDRVNLGYDGLFGPKTMFYHLSPNNTMPSGLMNTVDVPVLDVTKTSWLGAGTAAVVAAGLFWVLLKMILVAASKGRVSRSSSMHDKKLQ